MQKYEKTTLTNDLNKKLEPIKKKHSTSLAILKNVKILFHEHKF